MSLVVALCPSCLAFSEPFRYRRGSTGGSTLCPARCGSGWAADLVYARHASRVIADARARRREQRAAAAAAGRRA